MIGTRRFAARLTAVLAALGVAGAVAVTAATTASASIAAPSPDVCDLGFVWRQAVPSDHVCVTIPQRTQTFYDNSVAAIRVDPNGAFGPNSCVQGFVWREAVPGDLVCVTPAQRSQAATDNSLAASRAIGNGIGLGWPSITFTDPIADGGWASLTLYGDGEYEFAGSFHDSGSVSYDSNLVWAFRSGDGTVFTFTDSGHEAGTAELFFSGGSRDHSWDVTGTNAQLQADWANIQQDGWYQKADASVSTDLGGLFNDLKQVIGTVTSVVSVVGPLLG